MKVLPHLLFGASCLVALGASAWAGEIQTTSPSGGVSQVVRLKAKRNDPVCAYQGDAAVMCGEVTHQWGHHSIVQWSTRTSSGVATPGLRVGISNPPPPLGERLIGSPLIMEREAAQLLFRVSTIESTATADASSYSAQGDLTGSTMQLGLAANGASVAGTVQFHLEGNWALTAGLNYYPLERLGVKAKLLGLLGGIHYYPFGLWRGLWVQGALGYYSASTQWGSRTGTQSTFSFLSTVGWRFDFNDWRVGIAGGGQYFKLNPATNLGFTLQTLAPTVWVDLSILL